MSKNKLIFKIEKEEYCIKIRDYLKQVEKLSSRLIRGAAREGRIYVNGNKIKMSYILKKHDLIELDIVKNESQNIEPEKMDIDVVYEDEDVMVVNKKSGMVVHPTRSHPQGTLANGLIYYFREKGENCIVRLVSRLDMDTSGLIIIAKNQFAHMALSRDMNFKEFEKSYLAIVHGKLKEDKGTINLPIYRPEEDRIKRVVDKRGQISITHFQVLESYAKGELVKLTLETGRTHQIRVHLSHIGHPIYGDSLYGIKEDCDFIKRQALHAYRLKFPHPKTGKIIEIESKLPEDMAILRDELVGN
ncbi:ribosomal large subunit pseudouridine synthase D [Clostridium acetireducens DSM 10703]|jgi:23S rRNA pseudouridine1911/1915/1917 synthase|uniref:Pseudouridine synthase n=1 Tax=Clostridium acetireducens DSM 10703 TaxID=1121290 RepID=A0A1E8F181_9CLOT|nr:RluA family pseudouridine synthase [Clostridium acetireducens]OFI07206.1 ribosomal large subunit pseudouridine synthase D [Clostridium acetireducens DSM 10703]